MSKRIKPYLEPIQKLNLNAEETARRLGISVKLLDVLRKRHPLYRPDCDMPHYREGGQEKKSLPLWSDEKIRFIAFAWRKTPAGVRRFTDDEALVFWEDFCDAIQGEYIAVAERKRSYIKR